MGIGKGSGATERSAAGRVRGRSIKPKMPRTPRGADSLLRGGLLLVIVVVVVVDGGDDADGALALAERLEAHPLRLHDGHPLVHLVGRLDEELVEQRARAEAEGERADDRDPRPRPLAPRAVVLGVAPAAAAQLAAVGELAELAADRVAHIAEEG